MIKITPIFYLIASIFLFSCGNDKKNQEPEVITVATAEKTEYKAADTEVEFKDPKIAVVYNAYINLKTALVNTNNAKTAEAASSLMTAFANVGVEEEILQAAQNISEAADIEVQRRAFVTVTTAVEGMLEGAISSGTVYKQFCPMAFNNQGGYWLSNSKEIYNPYFGDKMLKCGRVADELK